MRFLNSRLPALATAGLLTAFTALAADEPDLFRVGFDGFSVTADSAKGSPVSTSFRNPDLQLRMFQNTVDGKGNALHLATTEFCAYKLEGNFHSGKGSLSFWVSSGGWKPSDDGPIVFFKAESPERDYSMLVYKNYTHELSFYQGWNTVNGKRRALVALKKISDAEWAPGKWHKIDAVWNAAGMKLYLDGSLAAERVYADFEKVVPPDIEKGRIMLGDDFKWKDLNRETGTVFDDLSITDRELSPVEIRRNFEQRSPAPAASVPVVKERPVTGIPSAKKAISADGKIDADEWSDAVKIPIGNHYSASDPTVYPEPASVRLKFDGDKLYAALSSPLPSMKTKVSERDNVNVFMDDCFEIHLVSPRGKTVQYIVNANNAFFDSRDEDGKWNGKTLTAASRGTDSWSAEFIIPASDFDEKDFSGDWGGNFVWTIAGNGYSQFSWAPVILRKGFVGSAGKLGFGKECVSMEKTGFVSTGKIGLLLTPMPGGTNPATSLKLQVEGELKPVSASNITGEEWKRNLPPGRHFLEWESRNKTGQVISRGGFGFLVNLPVALTFNCFGESGYIDVSTDLGSADGDILKEIYGEGIRGKIFLVERANGKTVSEADVFLHKESRLTKRLSLPKDIASGIHDLRVVFNTASKKLEASTELAVPDFTPYREKVGCDETIPSPWTKIEKTGDRTWKTAGSVFRFGEGPLPAGILNRGDELFTLPPEYELSTEKGKSPIRWSGFRVTAEHPDRILLSGTGTADGLSFEWNGDLWFDGTYRWNLRMSPSESAAVRIDALRLKWGLRPEFAKYVTHPLYTPWADGKINLRWSIEEEEVLCTQTGDMKGLSWWCESDANWVNGKEEKQILLEKTPSSGVLTTIGIITRPAELSKSASYTMTLTSTPQKNPPKNYLDFEFFGKDSVLNMQYDISLLKEPMPDEPTSFTSIVPCDREKFRKFCANRKKWGSPISMYTCAFHLDFCEEEYPYFINDWIKRPAMVAGCSVNARTREKGNNVACCAGEGVTDLFSFRLVKLFEEAPDLVGVYYDCCHFPSCNSIQHGCGKKDAFGKDSGISTAWKLRGALLRYYKIHKRFGRTMICHGHNKFSPIAHIFSDYWWPGEEYTTYPNGMDPVYLYCDLPVEWLQGAYNSAIRGVGVILLPETSRSVAYVPGILNRIKASGGMEQAAWAHMTPMILHNAMMSKAYVAPEPVDKWWKLKREIRLGEAEFTGYWYLPAVTSASPGVYASVYSWKEGSDAPYSKVIVVGNLSRKDLPAALSIHEKAFGTEGKKITLHDLWNNGREISINDLAAMTVPSGRFLPIGVKIKK